MTEINLTYFKKHIQNKMKTTEKNANLVDQTKEKNLSGSEMFLSKNSVSASEQLTQDDMTLIKKVLGYYCPFLTQDDKGQNLYIEIINYIAASGRINSDDIPAIRTALSFIKSKAHLQLSKSKGTSNDDALLRKIYRTLYFDIEDVLKKL